MEYRPRLVDNVLAHRMALTGAVEVVGPKWCGKTTTAARACAEVLEADAPGMAGVLGSSAGRQLLAAYQKPLLIDEWQKAPACWDAVRREVDASGGQPGQFVLTGSCGLNSREREQIQHTGTGRFAWLAMSTMTLQEMGLSSGAVSLGALFDDEGAVAPAPCSATLADVADWCRAGGWPGTLGLPVDGRAEMAEAYVQGVLRENVEKDGLSAPLMERLMRSLARCLGQAPTYKTLKADMGEPSLSDATVARYLDALTRLHVVQEVRGWEPALRAKGRVRTKPRRYLCDPSLACALLFADGAALLGDPKTLGFVFENLAVHDLSCYLAALGRPRDAVRYYRDEKGLEVDVVLEHAGRWAPVEVKLTDAPSAVEDAARNIGRLVSKVCSQGNEPPAFQAVLVGTGALAYRRDDGLWVIPIAALGV